MENQNQSTKNYVLPHCPSCGANMFWQTGKKGAFVSCTRFPICKGKLNLDDLKKNARNPKYTDKIKKGKRLDKSALQEYHRVKRSVWNRMGTHNPSNIQLISMLERILKREVATISDMKLAIIELSRI